MLSRVCLKDQAARFIRFRSRDSLTGMTPIPNLIAYSGGYIFTVMLEMRIGKGREVAKNLQRLSAKYS